MFTRNTLRIATGLLVAVLAGCGKYTVTFEVGDVINAHGDDASRTMLDVDIICLTKEEAERHPEIVNRTMLADAWFKARDTDYAMNQAWISAMVRVMPQYPPISPQRRMRWPLASSSTDMRSSSEVSELIKTFIHAGDARGKPAT